MLICIGKHPCKQSLLQDRTASRLARKWSRSAQGVARILTNISACVLVLSSNYMTWLLFECPQPFSESHIQAAVPILGSGTQSSCDQSHASVRVAAIKDTDTHMSKGTFGLYPQKMYWREITRER